MANKVNNPAGEAAASDVVACPCIYCAHNRETVCDCAPCLFIRQQWGDDFHKDNR